MSSTATYTAPHIPLHVNEEHKRDISLWIDCYDDIFSDFDPRTYSERNISDDFLYEIRKMSRENDSMIRELVLLVPDGVRDKTLEDTITKRLHEHFRKSYYYLSSQVKTERKRGLSYLPIGLSMMLLASYISSLHTTRITLNMLFILLEPTGWYLSWIGFDALFKSEKSRESELSSYAKLQRCKIIFRNIPS